MNLPPRRICLTPCRNEAWVLGTQLSAASVWADRIVVGDQMSDDGTRALVSRFPKAWLLDNPAPGYDEGERHRVVFDGSRTLYPGEKKVLFAIDADELLSANWQTSEEWKTIADLPPGTGIYASWANVNPDFATWWPLGGAFVIGVVDDGRIAHSPGKFHVPRLLPNPNLPRFILQEIRLLHLQYTDPNRSQSKNRAYQVQEWLVKPERPIRLFRRFNSTLGIRSRDVQPLRREWVEGFAAQGVNWQLIRVDQVYRWDKLVLDAILERGAAFFRKLDIWDIQWHNVAKQYGMDVDAHSVNDPRSVVEKCVHNFLRKTQSRMSATWVRVIQQMLRPLGW